MEAVLCKAIVTLESLQGGRFLEELEASTHKIIEILNQPHGSAHLEDGDQLEHSFLTDVI